MAENLNLAADSRYKDTPVYAATGGPMFALFEAPAEFTQVQTDARRHRVHQHEIGMLDALAVRYYGPTQESLWWAIALANAILDPEEMYAGQVLLIPPRSAILSFISRVPSV